MTRRKSTKKDAESDYDSSPKPADTKGKRKKRKTGNSKHASDKSGALLRFMADMPVDVLLEIFKHLALVDLMHLSRTSKALRSILMSRSSISVWKQAVANDGLPQCTNDLNEPQLAELIFGRSCDWCGRNVSGQEILWTSRVRACKRCIGLAFKPASNYFEYKERYPAELGKLIPSVIIKNKRYIDGDLDRKWREEYLAKRSESETSKWLETLVAERRIIFEHAAACQDWFKSRHETRVMLRMAEILDRLKERGWKEELDKLHGSGPKNLNEVVKACQSELTEPILASLDNVLDKYMEDIKAARLVREKKQFFKHMLEKLRKISREYSHTLPPNHIFPNTADIYFHPIVNVALSAVESHDDEALEEALTRIRPSLPEIVDDCLKLSKQRLTNLVIDDYTLHNKSFDLSVLTLASTLFYCKGCFCDLTLDQTIAHACLDHYYGYYYPFPKDMEAVRVAISEVVTTYKIEKVISFSLARLERFASVLHSCGIDPNTTTTTDMNEIDPVIECLDCSNVERGRVTMKWLSIVKHVLGHYPTNVSLLDEPEAEIVRARMLEQYQKDTAKSKVHICAHCRDNGGSMALMQHVKHNHNIDSPVYGQDVIVCPTATGIRAEYNLWPPIL